MDYFRTYHINAKFKVKSKDSCTGEITETSPNEEIFTCSAEILFKEAKNIEKSEDTRIRIAVQRKKFPKSADEILGNISLLLTVSAELPRQINNVTGLFSSAETLTTSQSFSRPAKELLTARPVTTGGDHSKLPANYQ